MLPNKGGAGEGRRRLLATVAKAKLTYAASTWAEATKTAKNRELLARVTRVGALRTTRAYRTVPTDAVHVLASTIPGDLLVEESAAIRILKASGVGQSEARVAARQETTTKWQANWDAAIKGRWTRRLIPLIRPWTERRHGETSYELTQLLTGHGCFEDYLERIGKAPTTVCQECDSQSSDTAEHTLLKCQAWDEQRQTLEQALGGKVTAETLTTRMVESPLLWEATDKFAREVIREKDRRQRERQDDRARRHTQ